MEPSSKRKYASGRKSTKEAERERLDAVRLHRRKTSGGSTYSPS